MPSNGPNVGYLEFKCSGCGEIVRFEVTGEHRSITLMKPSGAPWTGWLVVVDREIVHDCEHGRGGGEGGDREPRAPVESPPLVGAEWDEP